MLEDKTTEILKNAILLEKRGQAFYNKVAEQASSNAVREFFEKMADEEVKHVQILVEQFKAYQQDQKFISGDYQNDPSANFVTDVLTQELKEKMSAADYEAAAISAAISMEKKAIELYAARAAKAEDPNEKALYDWLAKWETQHLNLLAEIDKELIEQIWYDSNFWPF